MKAVLARGYFVILVAACAFKTLAIDAPPASSLQILPGIQTNTVKVVDAFNHLWILQSSSNLTTWTEVEALKVHNGKFSRAFPKDPATPELFFRAFYDSSRPDILSTVSNALLLPATPFNYAAPELPSRFLLDTFVLQDTMTASNVTTDTGAMLGRVLFYDKRLSSNQTVSCASCHKQANGFADPRPFSVGFNGGLTTRNSMGLNNARWYQRRHFFWDERAATLEDLILQPIQNSIEMGLTLDVLTNRLAAEPFYTNLFTQAFGSPDITTNHISRALAQFIRSIVTVKSKYDLGVTNNFNNFTTSEKLGRLLFFGSPGCARCHTTDNFVAGGKLQNNGLEFPFVDRGVGAITGIAGDNGTFKVPSLRNIELTGPYMHDGRFTNLEQVVEFYNSGVVSNANLSPFLRDANGRPRRLNLSPENKADLVAFLKTLTDLSLATDEKLSDPFNYGGQ